MGQEQLFYITHDREKERRDKEKEEWRQYLNDQVKERDNQRKKEEEQLKQFEAKEEERM